MHLTKDNVKEYVAALVACEGTQVYIEYWESYRPVNLVKVEGFGTINGFPAVLMRLDRGRWWLYRDNSAFYSNYWEARKDALQGKIYLRNEKITGWTETDAHIERQCKDITWLR